MTPSDLWNIYPTRNSCRDAFPCANMALKLPQYFTCWWRSLLVTTPMFGLLSIRRYCVTRKDLFLGHCIHFVYRIKGTMPAKFSIQNAYESLPKCKMHFVYKHFIYILYIFCLSKSVIHLVYKDFVYIFYTWILMHKKCTS